MLKRWFLALLLIILAAPSYADKKKPKTPKTDELILRVNPRMVMNARGPVKVNLTVQVSNPTTELYCSEITVAWGDDENSYWSGDCPPWEDKAHAPPEAADPHSFTHLYKYSGTFDIEVTLTRASKQLRKENIKVIINTLNEDDPDGNPFQN